MAETNAGRILALIDQGYSQKEVALELNIPVMRVNYVVKTAMSRVTDSRRIFEIYEMCVEILANSRAILLSAERKIAASEQRKLEKGGLAFKLGAAIDKIKPSPPDGSV